jgi:prepilin-type processing-associated H-X9-DG protein
VLDNQALRQILTRPLRATVAAVLFLILCSSPLELFPNASKANVVFCDSHVESPTLQFLFADTSDAALARWNRDHLPHREKLSP